MYAEHRPFYGRRLRRGGCDHNAMTEVRELCCHSGQVQRNETQEKPPGQPIAEDGEKPGRDPF